MSDSSIAVGYYFGDDTYALEEAARTLARRVAGEHGEALSRVRRAGSATSVPEITERVATATLFGGGTLVVVGDPYPLVRSTALRAALLETVASVAPGNALAFIESIEGGPGRRPAALKSFAEALAAEGAEVREFRALQGDRLVGWLDTQAKERGLQLGPGAAAALAERVGGFVRSGDVDRRLQSQLAVSELEKLGLYRLDAEIRAEDVRALVPEAIPASLWALVDAVGRRRGREALELLDRALAATPEPVLVSLFHRRIRELIEVLDLLSGGATLLDIGRLMKIGHEFRVRMLVEQARTWKAEELDAALAGLLDVDSLIKAGSSRRRVQLAFLLWISDRTSSGPRGAPDARPAGSASTSGGSDR